ncbi:innexin inx1-like [Tetranychus urticae]|uniref:innexin inx1-like n=1 Tax=Tetranychus urticae TaxID=32264 RepID=UPI00077BA4A5|nr:innexin inx1-like [Tetranychus urticae]
MLDLFIGLKRVTKRRTVHIDNAIFRLHWLFTSVILIAFSILLSGRQYVGEPIHCMETNNLPKTMINTYCWIQSTFIIPEPKQTAKQVSSAPTTSYLSINQRASYGETAHPWIRNSQGYTGNRKWQTYYQWVTFTLFFQGLLFYFPYYLWKLWEGGLIKTISLGMQIALITDEEKGHKRKIILDYFYRHFGHHRLYACKYFFCEALCLANVICQLYFTDWFFDGEFIDYGPLTVSYILSENRTSLVNPMIRMFPRMTKCRFQKYGDSGDISTYDILCMLPLNVVNEKIYLFLWFWYSILLILTVLLILFRLFIVICFSLRPYFLKSRCRLSKTKCLRLICARGNIGDWFLMYMLANNLDPLLIREITDGLGKKLERDANGSKNHIAMQAVQKIT